MAAKLVRPVVVLELPGDPALVRDLVAGGVFVPGCVLAINEDLELVVRGSNDELTVAARVVWIERDKGAGLQLIGCDTVMRQRIARMAGSEKEPREPEEPTSAAEPREPEEPASAAEPTESEESTNSEDDEVVRKIPRNVHERLRGLSLAQQVKLAHTGEIHERIILERMYGKNVWEALLRNPKLTGPEVARIARMGAVPRVLIEIIVNNGAWLQIPEVRRALLSNPRMGVDQILRVLRLLPKHELKLAAIQTAYPFAVRDQARRMLRDD
jgi:hypothetical protein